MFPETRVPETGNRKRYPEHVSELWEALPISGMSLTGLGGLIIGAVYRGWLIPRNTYNDLIKGRDDRIAELRKECDDRKAQGDALIAALQVRDVQFNELLELARTGNALMKAIIDAT